MKCVQALARFFCHKPDSGSKLKGGDRALFLAMLSTKESITLTAEKIPDEVVFEDKEKKMEIKGGRKKSTSGYQSTTALGSRVLPVHIKTESYIFFTN